MSRRHRLNDFETETFAANHWWYEASSQRDGVPCGKFGLLASAWRSRTQWGFRSQGILFGICWLAEPFVAKLSVFVCVTWAGVLCGETGLLFSRSKSHWGFNFLVNICLPYNLKLNRWTLLPSLVCWCIITKKSVSLRNDWVAAIEVKVTWFRFFFNDHFSHIIRTFEPFHSKWWRMMTA